ncbi:MAG TPA: aminoacyl-tRNA hydrolase [Vicinamibacterales bacterium]|nr:aminoacyl-tRNA hydrolase [Vicinamibacterales bacterium]
MKLIAGLGNPGRRYVGTRHNLGFVVLDTVADRRGLEWESAPAQATIAKWRAAGVLLAKPLTFVNASGRAVGELLRFFKIETADLLVVVDDVNLELGRLRARPSGSAGGHNGLKSVIAELGTEEFARLRIGVGRGDGRRDLADHVLARFEPEERPIVADIVARTADAIELFVTEGIGPVMNRYNRKEDGE